MDILKGVIPYILIYINIFAIAVIIRHNVKDENSIINIFTDLGSDLFSSLTKKIIAEITDRLIIATAQSSKNPLRAYCE